MPTGYRRLDQCAIFALMPQTRPGMTLVDLMLAAGLDDDARGACQSCLQRWKKWGAIRMVSKRSGAGLWIRTWTTEQLRQWLAGSSERQRAGRPVATTPKRRRNMRPDYGEACAQLQSLGSMCEALRKD